jgi:hypothetical protein
LRCWELVTTEVQATGLFTLVTIVDDMTGEDIVASPFLGIFGNGKACVASEAYDDETTECSTQLEGTDPFPIMAGDELVSGISKPS